MDTEQELREVFDDEYLQELASETNRIEGYLVSDIELCVQKNTVIH